MATINTLIETPTDIASVEYRLNNRKKLSTTNSNNSRTFAVELSNGSMVKIVVSSDQAEQFEREMSVAIQQNPDADIGNILYELTRFFDIFDIQWMGAFDDDAPVVETDQNAEDQGNPNPPQDTSDHTPPTPQDQHVDDVKDTEGNGNDDGMFDDNNPVDLNDIDDDSGDSSVDDLSTPSLKDVLQTLITQLTSDSEARTAEANARRAEADAQKAQAVARAMELRVGQEQEIQAMEDWESRKKEQKTKDKEMDRLAKFRLAKAQGLTDSRRTTGSPLNEDWGSSDWSAVFRSIASHLARVGPESFDDMEDVQNAVSDAAEFYHEHMGYRSATDAERRIMHMLDVRTLLNDITIGQYLRKYVTVSETASMRSIAHIRDITAALRARPQTSDQAMDAMQNAAVDLITDIPAQRAEVVNDINRVRKSGASQDQVRDEQQIGALRINFARKVQALKQQLQAGITRVTKQ